MKWVTVVVTIVAVIMLTMYVWEVKKNAALRAEFNSAAGAVILAVKLHKECDKGLRELRAASWGR